MSVYKHKTIEISPQVKLDSEINSRFLLNEQGDLYFYCVIIVHILSSSVKTIQKKLSEGKKIWVKACTKPLLGDANYDLEKSILRTRYVHVV